MSEKSLVAQYHPHVIEDAFKMCNQDHDKGSTVTKRRSVYCGYCVYLKQCERVRRKNSENTLH